MIDYANICSECGELFDENVEHWGKSAPAAMGLTEADKHEYEPGCYCGDRGKCEVCVDRAVDYADYLRKAAKEG